MLLITRRSYSLPCPCLSGCYPTADTDELTGEACVSEPSPFSLFVSSCRVRCKSGSFSSSDSTYLVVYRTCAIADGAFWVLRWHLVRAGLINRRAFMNAPEL